MCYVELNKYLYEKLSTLLGRRFFLQSHNLDIITQVKMGQSLKPYFITCGLCCIFHLWKTETAQFIMQLCVHVCGRFRCDNLTDGCLINVTSVANFARTNAQTGSSNRISSYTQWSDEIYWVSWMFVSLLFWNVFIICECHVNRLAIVLKIADDIRSRSSATSIEKLEEPK